MKCIIRDDDTCGLTRAEELQKCYASILPEIPVCLSVTPLRIPGPHFDVIRKDMDKPWPLEHNTELVGFLKTGIKNGYLDVALHGYHHVVTTIKNGPSLGTRDKPWWREYLYGDDLERKTCHGKQYLEYILGYRINTFVPPGNAISKNGLQAIIDQKLNLVGSPTLRLLSFKHRPFNPLNFLNAVKGKLWKIRNRDHTKYPFVLDFKTHKEIAYYLLYPSTDLTELKKEVDFVHSVNGIFLLSTHYHAFQKKIRSGETIEYAFHSVLDYISGKDNVHFITYRELWR